MAMDLILQRMEKAKKCEGVARYENVAGNMISNNDHEAGPARFNRLSEQCAVKILFHVAQDFV